MADIEPPPLDKTACADCGCGAHQHQIGPFRYCGTCTGCRGFVPVHPQPPPVVHTGRVWSEVPVAEVREGMTVANYGTVIRARHMAGYSHIGIDTPFGPTDRNFIDGETLVVAQADAR